MNAPTVSTGSSRQAVRRWAPVALAAVVWWLLYRGNRPFWDRVVFDVAGMDPTSHWGEAVHFFFYDISKIVLLFGLFGWGITALYIASGLLIAIVAGTVLGRLNLERWVEPFVFETRLRGKPIDPSKGLTWDDRLAMGREEVVSILRKVWPYLLVGIGVGAVIHGWAPEAWFAEHATGPLGVPIAVVIGVPLYSNAAGVMPLIEVLHDKGVPMGTLLAFMMSVVALSLPEMILLRRVLKPRLIATYVGVVASGILATGLLFNLVV